VQVGPQLLLPKVMMVVIQYLLLSHQRAVGVVRLVNSVETVAMAVLGEGVGEISILLEQVKLVKDFLVGLVILVLRQAEVAVEQLVQALM
jgi:hypothetical protein